MTRKTSAGWARALVRSFELQGFNSSALFQKADFSESVLMSDSDISQDQITQLWDAASAITENPVFGLETGAGLSINALGPVSYALMSCKTLGDSFRLLVQYQHIIADALDLSVNTRGNITELVFNNIGDNKPPSYHSIDAAMSAFLSFYSWVSRESVPLNSVNFIRRNISNFDAYHSFFNCKVRPGQNNNSIWLSNETLLRELPTADETMSELHGQALVKLANEKLQSDFRRTVADLIRQSITDENFGLEMVATRLFMSKSSLQRRLRQEQLNFQQLLDETREYLAIAWLRQTPLPISVIAQQLGFASASGFTRTFKSWTGKTPKEYRER